MRPTVEIDGTLLALHTLFDAALKTGTNTKTLNYYCKLALIELCGWVEQAMDQLILDSVQRSGIAGHAAIKDSVDHTYAFDYDDSFRPLLILLVGYKQCEAIETKLLAAPVSAFSTMKNLLSGLRGQRNQHAHTHLESNHAQIAAPSSIRSNLKQT